MLPPVQVWGGLRCHCCKAVRANPAVNSCILPDAMHLPIATLSSGPVCRSWQRWLAWLDRHLWDHPDSAAGRWQLSGKFSQSPPSLVQNSVFHKPFHIDLRDIFSCCLQESCFFSCLYLSITKPTSGKNKSGMGITLLFFPWLLLPFLFLMTSLSPLVCWQPAPFPSSSTCFCLCWVKWKQKGLFML